MSDDPFNDLNKALLQQKKGIQENQQQEESKGHAERREA